MWAGVRFVLAACVATTLVTPTTGAAPAAAYYYLPGTYDVEKKLEQLFNTLGLRVGVNGYSNDFDKHLKPQFYNQNPWFVNRFANYQWDWSYAYWQKQQYWSYFYWKHNPEVHGYWYTQKAERNEYMSYPYWLSNWDPAYFETQQVQHYQEVKNNFYGTWNYWYWRTHPDAHGYAYQWTWAYWFKENDKRVDADNYAYWKNSLLNEHQHAPQVWNPAWTYYSYTYYNSYYSTWKEKHQYAYEGWKANRPKWQGKAWNQWWSSYWWYNYYGNNYTWPYWSYSYWYKYWYAYSSWQDHSANAKDPCKWGGKHNKHGRIECSSSSSSSTTTTTAAAAATITSTTKKSNNNNNNNAATSTAATTTTQAAAKASTKANNNNNNNNNNAGTTTKANNNNNNNNAATTTDGGEKSSSYTDDASMPGAGPEAIDMPKTDVNLIIGLVVSFLTLVGIVALSCCCCGCCPSMCGRGRKRRRQVKVLLAKEGNEKRTHRSSGRKKAYHDIELGSDDSQDDSSDGSDASMYSDGGSSGSGSGSGSSSDSAAESDEEPKKEKVV